MAPAPGCSSARAAPRGRSPSRPPSCGPTCTCCRAARAQRFADWARSRGARVQPARGALEPEVAINATPLGLKETDPLPLDPARTERLSAALDLVYCRGGTRWVRALRAAGIPAHDGREMLVQQGVAAFARFFPGHPAPVEVMRAAVHHALGA